MGGPLRGAVLVLALGVLAAAQVKQVSGLIKERYPYSHYLGEITPLLVIIYLFIYFCGC